MAGCCKVKLLDGYCTVPSMPELDAMEHDGDTRMGFVRCDVLKHDFGFRFFLNVPGLR